MRFSLIVPVFNRPDEIEELLESLTKQSFKDFEIIIVEDGSELDCRKIVEKYREYFDIQYFYKENEGPAVARNYGSGYAKGEYLVFLDSDVIVPPQYFEVVDSSLKQEAVDAYGGPDAATEDFTVIQRAISYSMTAMITSGKIRGGEKIDKFYPRSFNMGVKKDVFIKLGGFPDTWPSEDIEFAIKLIRQGYKTKLIKEAFVYHKRRNTLKSFFRQVYPFGRKRYYLSLIYPETFKIYYIFPSAFTLGTLLLIGLSLWKWWFILPLLLFVLMVFVDSLLRNKSLSVAFFSVITTFIQHFGYGLGFLRSFFTHIFRGRDYLAKQFVFKQKTRAKKPEK